MTGEEQDALQAAMAALAAESESLGAPAEVEAAVLNEFEARRSVRWQWMPVAASIVAAAMVLHGPAPAPRASRERPFIQIPYVAPLAPYERVAVRRMDVPVTALIAAGFEMHARDLGAAIAADVLVGQDGRALALRLIDERRD